MDSSQRVSISAANIADFFNTVGRRAADRVQGQDTFPMGGYFNEFRRSAVTVTLVEQLRAAVEQCMTVSVLRRKTPFCNKRDRGGHMAGNRVVRD